MMTNNTDLRWYVFNGKDSTPLTWDDKYENPEEL